MLRVLLLSSAIYVVSCAISHDSDGRVIFERLENPPVYDHEVESIHTQRPLVIAHRGSSGILPEHTREAYRNAIELAGADAIECDVSVSKDGHFVCRAEPFLSESTDIANHTEFADRKRTIVDFEYYGTLRTITDWFLPDFTLAELKTLGMIQVNSERYQGYNGQFQITTFAEYVEIAQSADRTIVIEPEMKYPKWINSLKIFDTSFEKAFVETLNTFGYSTVDDPCLIQSFEMDSLRIMAKLTDLNLMMAIKYDYQATSELIQQYAEFAYGVIAWKCSLVDHYGPTGEYKNFIRGVSDMVDRIHAAGMKVHVYTFRNENSNLPWDVEQDPDSEYDLYMQIGVDGFFTDFPGTLSRYLYDLYWECPEDDESDDSDDSWWSDEDDPWSEEL